MHFAIISGSHRTEGQSLNVASFCKEALSSKSHTAEIVDLSEGKLPLWDESVWENDPKWDATWGKIKTTLLASDGLIIVSPEYAGMVPASLKNFFLFLGGPVVAHKPALLIGVSAGAGGGSYPIAELRASSYKNNKIVYIPDHVIVKQVETAMKQEYIPTRIKYSIDTLIEYAQALKPIRALSWINPKDYANGM